MLQRLSDLLLIKNGEQHQVFYLLLLFFFIGAGMALGRGASEALFFKRYGIEYLPLMYIITSMLLCIVSLIYAAFVDRLPSELFYKILFIVLAVSLCGNWYAASYSESKLVYPVFFLLYEVASELLLIHCAVYVNQNLVQTQSKRLTPIVLAGHQIGVICGGILLATISPLLGVKNMMLLWGLLLVVSYIIIRYWHTKKGVSPYFRAGRKGNSKLKQSLNELIQGMKLMKTSRLLRMSSFSLFFMVVAVYILSYSVNNIYTEQFETEEALSSFFGVLTAITGTFALLIQLFITNRLIRDQGIKRVNYIFPLTSIFSYTWLLVSFTLPSAIIGSFNKETLLPAFANPVRNIFNASLPPQLQGRAQAIAVILVIPLGLICAGVLLLLAQNMDDMDNFLIIGLACSIAYLIFNSEMNQTYAQEILSNLKKRLFIPDKFIDRFLHKNQKDIIKNIEQGVMSNEDDLSIVYARVLSKSAPERAAKIIPIRMKDTTNAVKDQMVKILQTIQSDNLRKSLIEELGTGDLHLDATLLKTLFHAREPEEKYRVTRLLENDNPRIKAIAIYGALHYPIPELIEKAVNQLVILLNSDKAAVYMPALELLVPEFKALYQTSPLRETVEKKLKIMLQHDDCHCNNLALEILSTWSPETFPDINTLISPLTKSNNWVIRNACISASALLSKAERDNLLNDFLEDQHPNVRNNSIKALASDHVDDISYIRRLLISDHPTSPRATQAMLEYLMETGADASIMHSISISLALDARQLNQASVFLRGSNASNTQEATLLAHAIDERVSSTTDLALFAIQASDQEDDIAVIRAGLNSNDNRQFSNAYELLSMLNDKEVKKIILPLFDDKITTKKTIHEDMPFDTINTLIAWIQNRSDPWLNECANYYSAALNDQPYV